MIYRRAIALLSLVAGLVALYLHLWKLGLAGTLSCSVEVRGCEFIMLGEYSYFLGYDVALIGTVGYTLLFIAAMVASMERFVDERWPTLVMMALIWPAVLFTIRLKYAEFVILDGFCPWCLESAITITLCAILVTLDWRRVRALNGQSEAENQRLV